MWFAIVGKRTAQGTTARTRIALGEALALERQHLVVAGSRVAATSSARAPVSSCSMKPASVTWPPPSG